MARPRNDILVQKTETLNGDNIKKSVAERYPWAPAFLESLAEVGIIKHACTAAGVRRQTAYEAKQRDAEFRDLWLDAEDDGTDVLLIEARRRAMGLLPPEGEVRKQASDNLLMFLIKGRRPEYRDNHDVGKAIEQVRALALITPPPPAIDITPSIPALAMSDPRDRRPR
jgi:hypothetical protein